MMRKNYFSSKELLCSILLGLFIVQMTVFVPVSSRADSKKNIEASIERRMNSPEVGNNEYKDFYTQEELDRVAVSNGVIVKFKPSLQDVDLNIRQNFQLKKQLESALAQDFSARYLSSVEAIFGEDHLNESVMSAGGFETSSFQLFKFRGLNLEQIKELEKVPEVEYVLPDVIGYGASFTPGDPGFGIQKPMFEKIGMQQAWDWMLQMEANNPGIRNQRNPVVAFLDSGTGHPDLNRNIYVNFGEIPNNGIDDDNNGYKDDYNGYNFVSNNSNVVDLANGHGLAVVGPGFSEVENEYIAGMTLNDRVNYLPVRILDDNNSFSLSFYIMAMNYVRVNRSNFNIKSVNMSLGGFGPASGSVMLALIDIYNSMPDVNFYGASGNLGVNLDVNQDAGIVALNSVKNGCVVGGVDQNDNWASFASFGQSSVSVVAQAVDVQTLYRFNQTGFANGTSLSTPQVATLDALIFKYRNLNAFERLQQIILSSDKVPGVAGRINPKGGRINVFSALSQTYQFSLPPAQISLQSTSYQVLKKQQFFVPVNVDAQGRSFTFVVDWKDGVVEEVTSLSHSFRKKGVFSPTVYAKTLDNGIVQNSNTVTFTVTVSKKK